MLRRLTSWTVASASADPEASGACRAAAPRGSSTALAEASGAGAGYADPVPDALRITPGADGLFYVEGELDGSDAAALASALAAALAATPRGPLLLDLDGLSWRMGSPSRAP